MYNPYKSLYTSDAFFLANNLHVKKKIGPFIWQNYFHTKCKYHVLKKNRFFGVQFFVFFLNLVRHSTVSL